jgi:hypothetical protein
LKPIIDNIQFPQTRYQPALNINTFSIEHFPQQARGKIANPGAEIVCKFDGLVFIPGFLYQTAGYLSIIVSNGDTFFFNT